MRIQGALEVGVLVARTVTRVDDFVVLRVVDVQFSRADADNRACSVSRVTQRLRDCCTIFLVQVANMKGVASIADGLPVELVRCGQGGEARPGEVGYGGQVKTVYRSQGYIERGGDYRNDIRML